MGRIPGDGGNCANLLAGTHGGGHNYWTEYSKMCRTNCHSQVTRAAAKPGRVSTLPPL